MSLPYRVVLYREKYAISYRDEDGRPLRHSLGTDDLTRANALAAEVWARIQATVHGHRIDSLVAAYISAKREEGTASVDRMQYAWRALDPTFTGLHLHEVSRVTCQAYAKRRAEAHILKQQCELGRGGDVTPLSSETIRYELALVRQACRWAAAEKLIDAAHVPTFWLPPQAPPRQRELTKAQFRQLVDGTTARHVRLYLILLISLAGRMGAILQLRWSQVDLERRVVSLNPPGRPQTNKRRATVPINNTAFDALVQAHSVRTIDHVIEYAGAPVGSIKKAVARAAANAGLKVSSHDIRHSAAVWMAQAGTPIEKIAEFLGHANIATTWRAYARFYPDHLRDAADALNVDVSLVPIGQSLHQAKGGRRRNAMLSGN